MWFKDNDLDNTDTQIYRFTRHVWGVNSSPFIALLAMKRLAEENPTNACQLTLNAVTNNRYMDDLLLAACSLKISKLLLKKELPYLIAGVLS